MAMNKFVKLFGRANNAIIGMVHLRALPGSPRFEGNFDKIVEKACSEAKIFKEAGMDAMMIENMHDVPFLRPEDLGPETTASMAVIAQILRQQYPSLPLGLQVLTAGNKQALAIAKTAGFDFIRAEGFVFAHVADKGVINSNAAELLRYRRRIEADNVLIFSDIKKKHSAHALTGDVGLRDTAKAAELFLSDGVIVTGKATGEATEVQDINRVQSAVSLPVLVGSGVGVENVSQFAGANGIIIGSSLKKHGLWSNDVDEDRVKFFMDKVTQMRSTASGSDSSSENLPPFPSIFAHGE